MDLVCSAPACKKILGHHSSDLFRVERDAYRLGWRWHGVPTGRAYFCEACAPRLPRKAVPSARAPRAVPVPPTMEFNPSLYVTDRRRRILAVLVEAEDPLWTGDIARQTGVPFGSVYPELKHLHAQGWVHIRASVAAPARMGQRARHLYHLTDAALSRAADIIEEN